MDNLIKATKLEKSFKGRRVIEGLDLTIYEGEVVALIGPNGAGKSTTIAMLLGILEPDSGEVIRWSKDYRGELGVQLQSTPFFEGYTAEENLELFSALYKLKLSKEKIEEILKECGLYEARKTSAIRMSIGQQKRLAIAVTTINNPKLIILDEPTAGLDPIARHEIRALIKDYASKNTSVMFSSHDMEEVEKIADRILFLFDGRIVDSGKPDELMKQYEAVNLEDLYIKIIEGEGEKHE